MITYILAVAFTATLTGLGITLISITLSSKGWSGEAVITGLVLGLCLLFGAYVFARLASL